MLKEKNIAGWDRALRAIVGLAALYMYLYAKDIMQWVYLLIGALCLITAAAGFSPLYSIVGISTLPKKEVKKEEVKAPPKPPTKAAAKKQKSELKPKKKAKKK